MRIRSALWKTLAASGSAKLEAKAVINGVEYPEILNPAVNRAMCPDALSVGNCVSATLQFSIRPVAGTPIPDNAAVAATLKTRFTDGQKASEWMTVGTFYANRRTTNKVTGTVTFQGFDAMRKADAPFPNLSGYPKAMDSAVMEIAHNIGIEIDERTWENIPTGAAYRVPLPASGEKMIKILGYVGGVYGGNWIVTPQNRLRLVPLLSTSAAPDAEDPASIIGVIGGISTGIPVTVTGVSASSGSKTYFAGNETGVVIRAPANPYMTQEIADALLLKYAGLSYVPYSIEKCLYDPALEIGDFLISRSDIQSVVCQENAYYGPAFRGDLSAPFVTESASETRSVSEAINSSGAVTEDLSVRIYKFSNQSAVSVGDGQSAEIINFDYAAGEGQDVVFHAEIKHTTETTEAGNVTDGWIENDAVITVTYYINGKAVDSYRPIKTETDGANLLHLTYHFQNGRFNAGNFRAALSLSGGSVAIAAGDANAYIIGQGYSGTDDNWITEDGLVFIGVESYPNQMEYETGDTLDLTGLVVKAYYADGTEKDVTADCAIDPAAGTAFDEAGETIVNLSYTEDGAEFRDSFSVWCVGDQYRILYIEVLEPPTKTEYLQGEQLSLDGLVVGAFQENGHVIVNIKPECSYSPAQGDALTTPGPVTVTVTRNYSVFGYGTLTAYFDAYVLTSENMSITAYPAKSDYAVGETLDYTGLTVTASAPDGSTRDVTADCTLIPPDGAEITEAGDIMVDVRYNEKSLGTFWVSATVGIIASGDWWTLYANGTLDIYCEGDMPDYGSGRAPWYSYRDIILSVTIGDSVTTIGYDAFEYCAALTSVTIPNSVTTIRNSAFFHCDSLTSVTIPNSVTTIGSGAFWGCAALTSVTIPDGVRTIGDNTFHYCTVLTSVTIPDSVTTIGYRAFSSCAALTSVTIPDGVRTIGGSAFEYCAALTSVTIPDSVTTIGSGAFYYCHALTSVTIPDSVRTIGDNAFADCRALESIDVESGNNYFVSESGILFNKDKSLLVQYPAGKSNAMYVIPDSVTTIRNSAFSHCAALTSVTIGDSVRTIGYNAFYYCRALTSVTIPDSVTTIENFAFYYCDSLSDVYYSGAESQWNAISISSSGNSALTSATIHYNSTGPT